MLPCSQAPDKRPTIDDVVSHPWLASYQAEIGDEVDKAVAEAQAKKARSAAGPDAGGKTADP